MKTELYTITTLSNLHVGSGDINFNIIDNQVQKDATTQLPIIHSSSLKGAFREHFESMEDTKKMVLYIFGGETKDNEGKKSSQAGAYSFFEAQILTRPVRSNSKPYFNAISPQVIKNLLKTIENFNIEFNEVLKEQLKSFSELPVQTNQPFIFEESSETFLEDSTAIYNSFDVSGLKDFLGENLALFDDITFTALDLPVIARNQLENGKSNNLWYEEVVPKQSKFFFTILKPRNIDPRDYDEKIKGFENRFENEGSIVQFGANKSIGYGYSKVVKVV